MIGDLHVHTCCSDGSRTPRQAVVEARRRGLDYVSFVDHDTTTGTAEAVTTGLRLGVSVIPGVEVSAWDPKRGRKVHVLGYNYRLPATAIERLCRPTREARDANTRRQIDEIRAAGFDLSLKAVLDRARDASGECAPCLYKQHVMLALIDAGYTDSIYSDLYRELFKGDGPAAHDIAYVDVYRAIDAIHADGGRAVLAHPGQLDSWDLVPELAAVGLDGIELLHEDHDGDDRRRVRELAAEHRLFMTGGSDDHGEYGSTTGMGELCAPDHAFAAITRPADSDVAWCVDLVRRADGIARDAAAAESREVTRKGGAVRDLVTEHDVAVERFLVDEIRTRHPDHGFLTEEHDHPQSGEAHRWVIDPIDGTTNFVNARADFAISVAHYRGAVPVFGVVYDVMADELYLGIAGEGAWLNGVGLPGYRHDAPTTLGDSVVGCSLNGAHRLSGYASARTDRLATATRAQRAHGSAALAICRIARGTLDAYIAPGLAFWDYAAARIIALEAGGSIAVGPPEEDDRLPERAGLLDGERRLVVAAAGKTLLEEVHSAILGDMRGLRTLR